MTSEWFTYHKGKVIQALRYHFITRREIKAMMILINVFALASAALFFFKKVNPLAFLMSSVLWFVLMLAFWYILPLLVYKRSAIFREVLRAQVDESGITLETERGSQYFAYTKFEKLIDSPHFYHLYLNARSFFIIPKEAFASEEQRALWELLHRQIPR